MKREFRTEIRVPAWKQCYRCRKPTIMHELVGRPSGVRTTKIYNLCGFQVAEYHTTEMVDLCPTCETQEIIALQQRRAGTLLLVGGATVALFAWPYVGAWGLVSAAIVTLGGAFFYRRKNKSLVVRGEKYDR